MTMFTKALGRGFLFCALYLLELSKDTLQSLSRNTTTGIRHNDFHCNILRGSETHGLIKGTAFNGNVSVLGVFH